MDYYGERFFARIFNQIEYLMGSFSDPDHILYWLYFVIASVAAGVFFILKKHEFKLFKDILKQESFRAELIFDIKSYGMKLILETCIIVFLGFKLYNIPKEKIMTLIESVGIPQLSFIQLQGYEGASIQAAFYFLLWDFSAYFSHYLMHTWKPLWSFHQYHHRAHQLNPMTKYRIHPVSAVLQTSIRTIVILFGTSLFLLFFRPDSFMPFVATTIIYRVLWNPLAHLRHSPIPISYGPTLSRFLVSPQMHQIHHSRDPKHFNKNFAVIFSFWDALFKTQYIPDPNEKVEFGMGPVRKSLTFELLNPFRDCWTQLKNLKLRGGGR